MKVLACSVQKGGAGKSATAHNLGAVLAARGVKVLLVDCDPQGTLTQGCGIEDASGKSLAEVLGGSKSGKLSLGDVVLHLKPKLDLVPADIALAVSELGLTQRLGRELVLRHALTKISGYDLVILDCPPSLGNMGVAALVAADAVLVPARPSPADLRSVQLFLQTLDDIRAELNPKLKLLGILPTFFDPRITSHTDFVAELQRVKVPLTDARIGTTTRIAEATGAGKSLAEYEPKNSQVASYEALGNEVQKWLGKM